MKSKMNYIIEMSHLEFPYQFELYPRKNDIHKNISGSGVFPMQQTLLYWPQL